MDKNLCKSGLASIVIGPNVYKQYFDKKKNKLLKITKKQIFIMILTI